MSAGSGQTLTSPTVKISPLRIMTPGIDSEDLISTPASTARTRFFRWLLEQRAFPNDTNGS